MMMKNIYKLGLVAMIAVLASCNDFFDTVPGTIMDLEGTFTNKNKTTEFLTNVYNFVPDDSRERYFKDGDYGGNRGGIWTAACIEGNYSWDWHASNEWQLGNTYASSDWINNWYIDYFRAISRATIFINNVDKCEEMRESERITKKAEARALRAYYYYLLLRLYGPVPLLGDVTIGGEDPVEEMLKPRNTVDECVEYIVTEFDKAAAEGLPNKASGSEQGRMDRGICKALKAQVLLYAASPLFNGNTDMASLVNTDGTQLFSQTEDQQKWVKARDAYKAFFDEFVPGQYDLYRTQFDGKHDPYESYRIASAGFDLTSEQVFFRMVDHGDRNYEITPCHKHVDNGAVKGGMGLSTTQQIVDLHFTNKGLRIDEDPDYKEYTGVPGPEYYGWPEDYNDPVNPERNYFLKNENKILKQWVNREPRFYVNITFNGSTWINDQTTWGKITTEVNYNGNSGYAQSGWDTPYGGYSLRKSAPKTNTGKHFVPILRIGGMYLAYAETLSACGDYEGAMKYVNLIRNRAGVAEYGTGTDSNGYQRIAYPADRTEVDKRIRRERLIEMAFEWNHFFDVRRWKVADMAKGDGWIYPTWHEGGEGGKMVGMDYHKDPPEFFEKVSFETRVFDKKHYFLPIPDADVRRNPLMVQNPGWQAE